MSEGVISIVLQKIDSQFAKAFEESDQERRRAQKCRSLTARGLMYMETTSKEL